MAYGQFPESIGFCLTFRASEAIPTARVAVMLDTSNEGCVSLCTTNHAALIGIALNTAAAAGDEVRVAVTGHSVVYAYANAALSIGDAVTSVDTTGYVDTATATKTILGLALTAATAKGDLVAVLVGAGSSIT
jgi:hypothetical protein